MSTKNVKFSLNGSEIDIKSPATASVLEVVLMVNDILSDSLQSALDKKARPANAPEDAAPVAMREFFLAQFSDGKNPEDLFRVDITHDDGRTYSGEATRKVITNRLFVATNIADYQTTIVKNVPVSAEGKAPKAKAQEADNV